jgi:hypothetical protein
LDVRVPTLIEWSSKLKRKDVGRDLLLVRLELIFIFAVGKEKYAAIAKHALGGKSLDHYVMTNNHDCQLFQRIREQAQCNSSACQIYQVFTSPHYNVPPPPSADVETVVTCLKIDNDLVSNALVDHLRIETRAICHDKETSEGSLLVKDNRVINLIFEYRQTEMMPRCYRCLFAMQCFQS